MFQSLFKSVDMFQYVLCNIPIDYSRLFQYIYNWFYYWFSAIVIISFIQSYLFFLNENSLDKKLIVWSALNYATQKYHLDSLYRSHTQLIHKLLFQYDIVLNSVKTRSIHDHQMSQLNHIQKRDNPTWNYPFQYILNQSVA